MKPLPTDLDILSDIYERYYDAFTKYSAQDKIRSAKILVPIDIKEIADGLNVDVDIVFGRLYYHLNKKYSYCQPNGSRVDFFTLAAGSDPNCVFPLLASVLAGLRDQARKDSTATCIAVGSLIVAFISMVISVSSCLHGPG